MSLACYFRAAIYHSDDTVRRKRTRITLGKQGQVGWRNLEIGNVWALALGVHAVAARAMHLEFQLADVHLFFLSEAIVLNKSAVVSIRIANFVLLTACSLGFDDVVRK